MKNKINNARFQRTHCIYLDPVARCPLHHQDHLPLGVIKTLLKITNIPLAPLLARDFA
jgi:hypothetical protein